MDVLKTANVAALAEVLRCAGVFDQMDGQTLADLERELAMQCMAAGERLSAPGDADDSLFVIHRGRITLITGDDDPDNAGEAELGPGDVVGHMALLAERTCRVTAQAMTDVELIRVTRPAYERLCCQYPEGMTALAQALTPRLHAEHVDAVISELFGELDEEALKALRREMEWVDVPRGTVLLREGQTADALYVVLHGCIRWFSQDPSRGHVIDEVGRGEPLGEVGLLTGDPLPATACAVRDSAALRIAGDALARLTAAYPQITQQMARIGFRRLQRQAALPGAGGPETATAFALIPSGPGLRLPELAEGLVAALSRLGPTLRLSRQRLDDALGRPGLAQVGTDHPYHVLLSAWLCEQEHHYRYIVYEADDALSPWAERCLRRADRVLLVGDGSARPPAEGVEAVLNKWAEAERIELVLLQRPDAVRPAGTAGWLARYRVAAHHHVRLASEEDYGRLARRLTGQAVGLVLGGGGARGYAHIGAMRALAEQGIHVDMVGGSSMGALVGANYAAGRGYEAMVELARRFSSPRQIMDFTLPMSSLLAGRKVTDLYQALFGDSRIEDLWMPFFCVSSNLTRAQPVLHQAGPLWEAIRATTSIAGVFAPVVKDGDVLVDGGVMNSFPVDIMRSVLDARVVIGINATPVADGPRHERSSCSTSGWQTLWNIVNPFAETRRVPWLVGSLMRATEVNSVYHLSETQRLADLLIEPPVGRFATLDLLAFEEIIEIGYQATRQSLAAWQDAKRG